MTTTKIMLTWNTDRKDEPIDDTRVIFGTGGFDQLSSIEKLDFLKDSIEQLSVVYDGLLASVNQGCSRICL